MPTFDPSNLPPSSNRDGYQVTSTQTTMQRSFERWLASPSPTTERLVDQALIGAGRAPMFGRIGASAQFVRPFEMPWQVRSYRQREISDFSRQANERMLAEGRARRTVQNRFPSFDIQGALQRSYGGTPRSVGNNLADWARPTAANVNRLTGPAVFWPDEIKRLFKHMDVSLDQINKTEQRILYLSSAGSQGSAGVGPQNLWRLPRFPRMAQPTGLAASPTVAQAFARHLNAAAGGGGDIPPPGGGGGPGGGAGHGGAFAGGLFGGVAGRRGMRSLWPVVAAEAAWQGAKLPLHAGHFLFNLYGSSKPYTDWQEQLANQTRLSSSFGPMAPGMGRRNLESGLLPGFRGALPPWMPELGVTQPLAADILGRVGGVRPGQEPLGMIESLRRLRLGSGFAMSPEGSVEGLASMGMKYGISGLRDPASFPRGFGQFMAQGQAGGADVHDLLGSIKESIEALVKTGIKLDLSASAGWAEFMQRMLSVNMPAAQAGVMGGQVVGGMAGAGQKPFANALTASVFSQLINDTDWNDPRQVKNLIGRTPEEIMRGGAPWEQTGLGMLQQGKSSPLSQLYGARMIGGSSSALPHIAQTIGRMTGATGPTAEAMTQVMMGTFLGGDFTLGSGALAGVRARRQPSIPGAEAPFGATLPEDAFRSRVEAFTDLFRGLYVDFEIFGKHLEDINRILERVGDHTFGPGASSNPGMSMGRTLWNMSPFSGSPPPSGGAWEGIKNFFGFGSTTPSGGTSIPGGGAASPGRQGAVTPRMGAPAGPGFMARAGTLMRDIMGNFSLSSAQAAGIVGNVGFESAGLQPGIQEKGVGSGRGGLGYAQWTGPRRKMFENWASEHGLSTRSEEANRGFLLWELANTKVGQKTIEAVRGTSTVEDSTFSAGRIYENPRGTTATYLPGYGSRLDYGRQALRSPLSISMAPSNGDMGATGDFGAGAGAGGAGHAELLDSFGVLGRIVRDTAEHLHDLGHGARNARSGIGGASSGPNASTSPASAPTAAAYP